MTAIRTLGMRRSNAVLIRDLHTLGYLPDIGTILDPTYNRGGFWTVWKPTNLIGTDIDPEFSPTLGISVDFTDMPFRSEAFSGITFDPPYKLNGTSTGRGPSALDVRYAVDGAYTGWKAKHNLIRRGIIECHRVLQPGGHLIVKCQDQVAGDQKRWQTIEFSTFARVMFGMVLVDQLHVRGHRAQPANRRQNHSHIDYSTALVLRKPR